MKAVNVSNKIIILGDTTLLPGEECVLTEVGPGEEALAAVGSLKLVEEPKPAPATVSTKSKK